MSREAMQMALEALEKVITAFGSGLTLQQNAITALRQALVDADDTSQKRVDETSKAEHEWVGLTDEEIQDLGYLSQKIDEGNSPWFDRLGFAKAIEQALKKKNKW
jgi:hypothetical protein